MDADILYEKLGKVLKSLKQGTDLANVINELEQLVDIKEPIVSPLVTVEQATLILKTLNNGTVSGMSAGKNGRAWLEGEFELCHLEALCVLVRAKAGDNAEGAVELYDYWKREDMLEN